jgi:pyruvate ferredoxin oxidoreductase alpha subunit
MLKIRCFRPFPADAVAEALKGRQAVGVLERSSCFGGEGNPVYTETCAALLHRDMSLKIVNYVYGLGGRDTIPAKFREVFQELLRIAAGGSTEPVRRFIGLRDF